MTAELCAHEALEVVPSVMRFLRVEMRSNRGSDLSVPQFRALGHLRHNPGTSLSALADHLGLTAATTSNLVDGLVRRQMVSREPSPGDRRRVALALSAPGRRAIDGTMAAAERNLATRLGALSEEDLRSIYRGLAALRRVFAPVPTKPGGSRLPRNARSPILDGRATLRGGGTA